LKIKFEWGKKVQNFFHFEFFPPFEKIGAICGLKMQLDIEIPLGAVAEPQG
jgi:hypothetical protein